MTGTELLLIRHCEDWSRADAAGSQSAQGLTGRGLAQAQALAAYLVQEVTRLGTIVALYSSPLLRCLETATPIAQALRLTANLAPQLRPDGEEPERVARFLMQLCEVHRSGRVVVVGHASTLAAASSAFSRATTGSGGFALATIGHGWLSRWRHEDEQPERTATWTLLQHCDLEQLRLDFPHAAPTTQPAALPRRSQRADLPTGPVGERR